MRRSAWGRRLVALSDSPAAFATLGMSPTISKMVVFGASAALAGVGGMLNFAREVYGSVMSPVWRLTPRYLRMHAVKEHTL